MEKVITENSVEIIKVKWDGDRYAIITERKHNDIGMATSVIILSPREMFDIVKFAGGKKE